MLLLVLASCTEPTAEPTVTTADTGDVKIVDVPEQTVYAYYDFDGDGVCDEGAQIYLRNTPDLETEIALSLPRGTEMLRNGIYYNNGKYGAGWSRVVYQGNVYYTTNSCLSIKNPGP